MIIVDTALAKRAETGSPVRVGMVGAGYVARFIALQIVSATVGMRLVAISNRTPAKAEGVYREAGATDIRRVDSVAELDASIRADHVAVTDNPSLLWECGQIDAIIEVTGDTEFGTRVAYESLRRGKHVVLVSAEVDASVGPILKVHADRAGVVVTYTDGDEPGVAMNLVRFVESMGCKAMLMGQLKGMLDRYRNPDTQREFAERHGVNAAIVASFADGSKLNLEAAVMGNATGFVPAVRGMHGYAVPNVRDLLERYSMDDFSAGGLVDYALGAEPHTGAFVIAYNDHPLRRQLLSYLKMGAGPLHMFVTPYHLPPMQLPHSVARAVLFNDATITPRGAPVCDTVSYAKRDLRAGERLDGMGGFTCYGLVDRYEICRKGNFLPIAISVDCRLKRDIAKDMPLTYDDVDLPPGRLVDRLREEQDRHFAT